MQKCNFAYSAYPLRSRLHLRQFSRGLVLLHHAVGSSHLVELPVSVGLAARFATIGNETRLFLGKTCKYNCCSAEQTKSMPTTCIVVLAYSLGECMQTGPCERNLVAVQDTFFL